MYSLQFSKNLPLPTYDLETMNKTNEISASEIMCKTEKTVDFSTYYYVAFVISSRVSHFYVVTLQRLRTRPRQQLLLLNYNPQ